MFISALFPCLKFFHEIIQIYILGTELSCMLHITVSEARNTVIFSFPCISMLSIILFMTNRGSKAVVLTDALKPHYQLLSYCHPLLEVIYK